MKDCYCGTCHVVWEADDVVVKEAVDHEPYGEGVVERVHLEAYCPKCRHTLELT